MTTDELTTKVERLREWLEIIANGEHIHPDDDPERTRGDFTPGPCVIGCPVWSAKRALEGE